MPDYQRIEEIYSKAILIADLDEKRRYVLDASDGDEQLFNEVWALCLAEPYIREEEDQLRSGQIIGNYRIIRQLAKGVLASVYLATHRIIGHSAAIKVFKKAAISVEGEEIWRRDSDILALLKHDSIARFYDAGFVKGKKVPYVIMEYIDGAFFNRYCDDDKLSIRERLKLFQELCQVIQYIHEHNVVHLDLKPTNILVATFPDRRIKLIDFSASKLLRIQGVNEYLAASQFSIAFSSNYASPEQINEKRELIGPTSDIYSLGCLLYEILTGCPPLELESISLEEKQRKINEEYPLAPSKRIEALHAPRYEKESVNTQKKYNPNTICKNRGVPPKQLTEVLSGDIDSITMKCLEKERGKRYQSVAELEHDIDLFLSGHAVKARGGHWLYKFNKFVARLFGSQTGAFGWDKWRVPVSRITGILALLTVAGFLWYATRPKMGLLPAIDTQNTTPIILYDNDGQTVRKLLPHEQRTQTLDNSTSLELVKIQGTADKPFRMGAVEAEFPQGFQEFFINELPPHEVRIKSFYMGRTEVTQSQWAAVAKMPKINEDLPLDPSETKGGSLPVTNITYKQVEEFFARLRRRTGRKYRLPTEAEWEYACRAGSDTIYGFGNKLTNEAANFGLARNTQVSAMDVEGANPFGLFHLNGNVWEWIQDRWHPTYDNNPPTDGSAWETIINYEVRGQTFSNEYRRVLRGGTYKDKLFWCRCSARTDGRDEPLVKNPWTGFRVALSAD